MVVVLNFPKRTRDYDKEFRDWMKAYNREDARSLITMGIVVVGLVVAFIVVFITSKGSS